jgi:hypothetical protein
MPHLPLLTIPEGDAQPMTGADSRRKKKKRKKKKRKEMRKLMMKFNIR